jgi:hypothetical protein
MVSQRLRVDFWSRVCLRDGSREEEGEEESYSLIKGLKRQITNHQAFASNKPKLPPIRSPPGELSIKINNRPRGWAEQEQEQQEEGGGGGGHLNTRRRRGRKEEIIQET